MTLDNLPLETEAVITTVGERERFAAVFWI